VREKLLEERKDLLENPLEELENPLENPLEEREGLQEEVDVDSAAM
jgi:hypothetical protein